MNTILRTLRLAGLSAIAAIAGFASQPAHALVIDSFNVGPQSIDLTGMTGMDDSLLTGLDTNHVIGGSRHLALEIISNPGNDTAISAVEMVLGSLTLDTGPRVESLTTVTWDANGAGLGADLTDGGISDAFEVSFLSIDQTATLMLSVEDGQGGAASFMMGGLTGGVLTVGYNSFTGSVNWQDISSITMKLTGPDALDASLDYVQTNQTVIPEPATLSLLGLGLVSAGLIRRRRKR